MPKVVKQSPKPVTRTNHEAQAEGGVKLCAYGRGKTGKTRLLASFPKPLLIIGTEDGTKSICTGKKLKTKLSTGNWVYSLEERGKPNGIDFVRLTASSEIEECAEMLASEGYASGGLDTAGGLQDLILKEILGLAETPVQKSWGMAQQQQWQICGAQLKERLRTLLDLADKRGINVVCIAHERNFNDESNSDVILPTVGAALTPSAAGWLNAACDYVCQTFLRAQVTLKESTIGGKTIKTPTKTGKIEYCLRVGPHEIYMTGFRLPSGAGELPEAIVDPTYEKIAKIIRGE